MIVVLQLSRIACTSNFFQRAWRCDLGASAVEFALIIPLLIMLIAGTLEFSNVYFVRHQIANVAEDAARRVASGTLSEAGGAAFVREKVAGITDAALDVDVTEAPLGEGEGADIFVSLSVPLKDILLFPVGDRWFDRSARVTASSTMFKP